jgi:hypothetical protein
MTAISSPVGARLSYAPRAESKILQGVTTRPTMKEGDTRAGQRGRSSADAAAATAATMP